jgi:hypothetical protein
LKLRLDQEMKELLWDVAITAVWVSIIYALLAMVSVLMAIVTTIEPSLAPARPYDIVVDALTTAIGVALGIGLGQPFVRRSHRVGDDEEMSESSSSGCD